MRFGIGTHINDRTIQPPPRTRGRVRDGDTDSLVVAMLPIERALNDAIAAIAHVVEAIALPHPQNVGIMRAGAVPEFRSARRQNDLDVPIRPGRLIGHGAGHLGMGHPSAMTQFARPTGVKKMILAVIAPHRRAAPNAILGILKERLRGHGLQPTAEIRINETRRRTSQPPTRAQRGQGKTTRRPVNEGATGEDGDGVHGAELRGRLKRGHHATQGGGSTRRSASNHRVAIFSAPAALGCTWSSIVSVRQSKSSA